MAKKKLTDREQEVMAFLTCDCSNAEIADRMGISESTVKNHVTSILKKLGAKNRAEAAEIHNSQFNERSFSLPRRLIRWLRRL